MRRRWRAWIVATFFLAALLRAPFLTRQGLWVDEIFSLAIATGHSLEHPAAAADERLGDFVEGRGARTAEEWRAYLRQDDPPAGPARVLRAVELSDTSPPLYYLGLWAWTRLLGTSDAALRGFSLACALAAVPLLARLARRAGGRPAELPACALYALSPLSIYYGTEGRMYALVWLELLVFAELSLLQRARGATWPRFLAWTAAGAAGFLTHYFFAFVCGAVWLACFVRPRRWRRSQLVAGAAAIGLAILPWYAHLGQSLGAWRVTMDWLRWEPRGFDRPTAALELFTGFFSGSALNLWGEHYLARTAALYLCVGLLLLLVARLRSRACGGRRLVVWSMFAGALAGPLLFDAANGTYTVAVPRYAIAGLPAALLLPALALGGLRPWLRLGLLAALACAWAPNLELLGRQRLRSWCPLREVANVVERDAAADDLVLVHSIPSGVLGVARYFDGPSPLAAWVGQLGERRSPESLLELARGKKRIHFVRMHEVGEPAPEEDWLRANAVLSGETRRESALVLHFRPRDGESF